MRINIGPFTPTLWRDYEQLYELDNRTKPPRPATQPQGLCAVAGGKGMESFLTAAVLLHPGEGHVLVDGLVVSGAPRLWHEALRRLVRPVLGYCAATGKTPIAHVRSPSLARFLVRHGFVVQPCVTLIAQPVLKPLG